MEYDKYRRYGLEYYKIVNIFCIYIVKDAELFMNYSITIFKDGVYNPGYFMIETSDLEKIDNEILIYERRRKLKSIWSRD